MAKASDNVFPKVEFAEGAAPATPGASKVRLYAKTDGLLYSKDDAGAETLVSGGAGGGSSASGARVRNSAAINLNNGSVTILTFDTERWDDAAYHSTSADTERLTVAAGRYLIGGHCQITAAGGTVGYIAIRQGGTNYIAVQNFDIGNAERYVSIATVWDCSGADYFEFGVFIDAGSKQALQATSFTPEFWIERTGDT